LGPKVLLRRGLDRRSHGIQQLVEFNFAHRRAPGQRAQGLKSPLFPD
jgi:hypothetical protein